MDHRRRIAVVTGTRAEYGHMKWMLHELQARPEIELQMVAASAHLSPYHGLTVAEIEADGFAIAARVDMLLAGDSPLAIAKSVGLGVIGFAEAFDRLKPDLVVVLGDRFEMLAAAETAMVLRIPIAHLHGGETTEGAIDEAIRHAITKMATYHFVAAEPYRQRVIQLGEQPARVFNFGAPGLDHITRTDLMDRTTLEMSLGMTLKDPVLLVTYHPQTLSQEEQGLAAERLVEALKAFDQATIIVTGVNADHGGAAMAKVLKEFVAARGQGIGIFDSLGYRRYLSAMRLASAVVGNSSSGLIEAPALKVPTVNIGDRQKGRLRASSVIDCADEVGAIVSSIHEALSPAFKSLAASTIAPYGQGDASRKIAESLVTVPLDDVLMKSFYSE